MRMRVIGRVSPALHRVATLHDAHRHAARAVHETENGRDVAKSEKQAAIWYRKASDLGHSPSMFSLGVLYQDGRGVQKDLVEAYKWLDLSSKHGFKDDRARAAGARDALAHEPAEDPLDERPARDRDHGLRDVRVEVADPRALPATEDDDLHESAAARGARTGLASRKPLLMWYPRSFQ